MCDAAFSFAFHRRFHCLFRGLPRFFSVAFNCLSAVSHQLTIGLLIQTRARVPIELIRVQRVERIAAGIDLPLCYIVPEGRCNITHSECNAVTLRLLRCLFTAQVLHGGAQPAGESTAAHARKHGPPSNMMMALITSATLLDAVVLRWPRNPAGRVQRGRDMVHRRAACTAVYTSCLSLMKC